MRFSVRMVFSGFLLLATLSGFPQHALAALPTTIPHQGRLLNSSNQPITTSVSVTFALFSASSGGSALWSETKPITPDSLGFYETFLGDTAALPSSLADPLYLEVTVQGQILTPRLRVGTVPFALQAGGLECAGCVDSAEILSGTIIDADIASGAAIAGTKIAPNFGNQNLATTGSAGIGTTSPGAQLTVRSSNDLTNDIAQFFANNLTQGIGIGYDRIVAIGSNSIQPILILPKGGSGVGIGTTTPSEKLDVEGDARIRGLVSCNTIDTNAFGKLICGTDETGGGGGDTTPDTIADDGVIALGTETSGAYDGTPDSIADDGTISDSEASDALTINNGLLYAPTSGSIGVGTTSPSAKLHVAGTTQVDGALFAAGTISTNSYGSFPRMGVGGIIPSQGLYVLGPTILDGTTSFEGTLSLNDQAVNLRGPSDPCHQLGWDAGVSGIVIKSCNSPVLLQYGQATNVGIGTATPAYKLDVAGQAHATSFPTSSDVRLKTNVVPLTGVLSKVEQIRGVEFDWNETYARLGRSSGHREIGVIAQEVEAVFPELVTTWGPEQYRAVDYGRLTGVLIEALKELHAQVHTLQTDNDALRQRIDALEAGAH